MLTQDTHQSQVLGVTITQSPSSIFPQAFWRLRYSYALGAVFHIEEFKSVKFLSRSAEFLR